MSDLRQQLLQRLAKFGVDERGKREDGFSGLFYADLEIGHFHSSGELDLRLGRDIIRKERLKRLPNSKVHPKRSENSPWIELPLSKRSDVTQIVELVRLVIKVSTNAD